MRAKHYKFTIQDIADAIGKEYKNTHSILRREGINLNDITQVALFITAYKLINLLNNK